MSCVPYNPNPQRKSVGDCTVRAVSKALGQSWEQTFAGLCLQGFMMCDMPNADDVWGRYLRDRGFTRHWIPDDCPDCMTVERFAQENPRGTFVLSMPGRHVLTVVDGDWWDSWDSGNEIPTYFFARSEDGKRNEEEI